MTLLIFELHSCIHLTKINVGEERMIWQAVKGEELKQEQEG